MIVAAIASAAVVACGGGAGETADRADQSDTVKVPAAGSVSEFVVPAGIWHGADEFGNELLLLVDATGRFRFVETATSGQGSGRVSANDDGSPGFWFDFFLIPPLTAPQTIWGWSAGCNVTGTLAVPGGLSGHRSCSYPDGSELSTEFQFDASAAYDTPADPGTLAGHWTMSTAPGSDILTIDSGGVLTGQDGSGTNCVYGGLVSVVHPDRSLFVVEWTFSGCTGAHNHYNDVVFDGFAFVDESPAGGRLRIVATGRVDGAVASLVLAYDPV